MMGRWASRLTGKTASTALFAAFLLLLFFEALRPISQTTYENEDSASVRDDHKTSLPLYEAPDNSPITASSPPQAVNVPGDGHSAAAEGPQLHIVVAHFSEEPLWVSKWIAGVRAVPYVQSIGAHVVIYTKNPDIDLGNLQAVSGADEVVRLPNVGREGGTYLHHLLEYYDHLPRFIWFSQAFLKKAQQVNEEHTAELVDWLDQRLRTKFGDNTGFMSLDRKHDICHCGHCTDMKRDDYYPLWPQIYAMLTGAVCLKHEAQVLSFNGHFIVSRKRILDRPRSLYEYLQELVDAPQGHAIHEEIEPKWFDQAKGKSSVSNPKFGHTLERLWHSIFNCSDPTVVVDCDLKAMKAEGSGGCSCND